MAFDLLTKKQTNRNWALTTVPKLPPSDPTRLDVALTSVRELARDNKVSFRGRGALVSRVIRF